MSSDALRILIVADHASLHFGGEAALPLHYFRVLRSRGDEAWLVVHERTRSELNEVFPEDFDRIFFIRDTWLHRALWKCGRIFPQRLAYFTFGMISRLTTQILQRRIVRQAVSQMRIDIVHQPIPVSPKEPSMLFGLGVPVVIGPMNGGMNYPPAFSHMQNRFVTWTMGLGRLSANVLNTVIPGKRRAATLLVANARTRAALPAAVRGKVVELVENGVDLSVWLPLDESRRQTSELPTRFVYVGRLVDWKAVDLLLQAFGQVVRQTNATLEIIGRGPEQQALEAQATQLGLTQNKHVTFAGFLSQPKCALRLQESDVLVLPSLLECGGAVVLEAMAMGLPVIATNWGGPADYVNESCGILVEPAERECFVNGLVSAMVRLSQSPELRRTLGYAGRRRVLQEFDWEAKVQQMMDIYREAVARATARN